VCPGFIKRWNRFARAAGRSWRVDETHIKVRGRWAYVDRAVTSEDRRSTSGSAAHAMYPRPRPASRRQSCMRGNRHIRLHSTALRLRIAAVREMRTHGLLPKATKLCSSKYLNNLIEQDHRGIKFRTLAMLGLKNIESAVIAIAGVELFRRIHQKSIRLRSTENQRPSCARHLECQSHRIKHNVTLSPIFGCGGSLHQRPVFRVRCLIVCHAPALKQRP